MMRSRMLTKLGRCCAIVALALLMLAEVAVAAEFSADFTQKMNTMSSTGKIFMKGSKIRMDMTQGTAKNTIIVRTDKKVTWILNPAGKTYMEMPLGGKEQIAYSSPEDPKVKAALKDLGDLKRVGKETVNGYPCDKYVFVFRDKKMGTQYVWVSQRLKVPIRAEGKSPNGTMLMDYKNIKEGRVADSVFDLPKGYKKTAMPGMAGGGRGGMRPGGRRGR